jgi:hypothetical protein
VRTPAQLKQPQFHCGKPPPAAEPRTRICKRDSLRPLQGGAAAHRRVPRGARRAARCCALRAPLDAVEVVLIGTNLGAHIDLDESRSLPVHSTTSAALGPAAQGLPRQGMASSAGVSTIVATQRVNGVPGVRPAGPRPIRALFLEGSLGLGGATFGSDPRTNRPPEGDATVADPGHSARDTLQPGPSNTGMRRARSSCPGSPSPSIKMVRSGPDRRGQRLRRHRCTHSLSMTIRTSTCLRRGRANPLALRWPVHRSGRCDRAIPSKT